MPPGVEFVDSSADGTCVLLPRFLPEDLWIPFDWLDLPAEWMGTAADRGTAGTLRGDGQSRTWQWGYRVRGEPAQSGFCHTPLALWASGGLRHD